LNSLTTPLIGEQQGAKRSGLFCKAGQVPIFHLFPGHFQNIDSFLQSLLREPPPDLRLDPIPIGIGRMLLPPGFPIIRMIPSPIPLSLLVSLPISSLPGSLTETFLFSLAPLATTRLLTIFQARIGIKTDGTPETLPLLHDFLHDEEIGKLFPKRLCYSQKEKNQKKDDDEKSLFLIRKKQETPENTLFYKKISKFIPE
jgi:hypothetical protein